MHWLQRQFSCLHRDWWTGWAYSPAAPCDPSPWLIEISCYPFKSQYVHLIQCSTQQCLVRQLQQLNNMILCCLFLLLPSCFGFSISFYSWGLHCQVIKTPSEEVVLFLQQIILVHKVLSKLNRFNSLHLNKVESTVCIWELICIVLRWSFFFTFTC